MSAPNIALTDDELTVAVADEMVAFHQRYHHRKPVVGKALLLSEELLACVLGGVSSEVEKTMMELQRTTSLPETRSQFQEVMQDQFIAAVERLSGRRVQAFISNHRAGPDIEIELFMLNKVSPGVEAERRLPSEGAVRGHAYAWERSREKSVRGYACAWERPREE